MSTSTPRLPGPTPILTEATRLLGEHAPDYDAYGKNASARLNAARDESPIFIEAVSAHLTSGGAR